MLLANTHITCTSSLSSAVSLLELSPVSNALPPASVYADMVQLTLDNLTLLGKSKKVRVIGSSSYREFVANNGK